ncbi:glycoside hydrolase family 97 protein [Pseudomarimonas arenosa]|uniref:Glycoside hydrolase family 97 protein n=1 Tax=Pseudomarimonas arenosa TaxID=2774145 RepID=A0AAW3ZNH6_9GAMM|nr:glycoside hydrolase family 97 protein [Pseudomarimonas arenosa]MBD8527089.1 glycoside hydrolase family 97 protein [Pseudomarimonas arenosa]
MRLGAFLCCLLLSTATQAKPDVVASVESPSGVLRLDVIIDEGRASYAVYRFGEPVIESSRLGFLLRGEEKLERNLSLQAQRTRAHDDTWEQPWGERRFVRDHHQELRVTLHESINLKRQFDVVFRLFDDGLGFRYEFPQRKGSSELIIDDELTEFVIAAPATAWWIPAGEWNRYEYLYNKTPVEQVGQAHTPMTLKTDDGLYLAFHEAALVDYAGMWLRRVEGRRFRAQLSPASEGWKVRRALPFHTPWRTIQIADSAAALYNSADISLNLNEPNKLGDVSWFRPHKYIGIWWELHLDTHSWATGARHGATTERAKKAIDFAAEHGFRGVLIEGWNVGWDGNWFGNGNDFNFTRATPDFDFKAVTDYASGKGVHIIGHHETGGSVSHYESQLSAGLKLYAAHGVDAVKTGYVTDAGQIERRDADGVLRREWHDGQWMSRHHLKVVTEAARHKIAINAHEPIKDTGLRRTYPNWVAREGARGMEFAAWGNPTNPPEHEVNLVFTRMLSGPMDFTPGILSLQGRGQAVQTTQAKQLALYVVLYSPIQMAADLPENYAKYPAAFRFIKDVPADWSETRVLNGEIGDYVTFARKDRHSEDWYLGSITDENGRLLEVSLDFLDPDRRYRAEIYRDGPDAHWRDNGFDIVIEQREINHRDRLTLRLAAGGGTAIRFAALE